MLTVTSTTRSLPLGWNCRPVLLPRSTSPNAGERLGEIGSESERLEHCDDTVTSTVV